MHDSAGAKRSSCGGHKTGKVFYSVMNLYLKYLLTKEVFGFGVYKVKFLKNLV